MARSKMEIECESALNIATAMLDSLAHLESWWPASRRGSNARRALDEIKAKRDAIEQCLRDALRGDALE